MTAPTVIPQTSEEMSEFLMDNKRRKEVFATDADPKVLTEFLNSYAKLTNKADPGIERQISEQVERGIASFLRADSEDGKAFRASLKRPDNAPANLAELKASRATGAKYSNQAAGHKLNGQFDNIVQFLDAVSDKPDLTNAPLMAKREMVRNAMSSTDPGSGGFLIPEEFRAQLLEVALENAVVRPRAQVIPMASLRAAIPMIDATTNSGSIYGGIIAYWTEEGAPLTQSQPAFARIVLEAKKLTAYTEVPNELRMDSAISVDAFVNQAFPRAIAWFEDIAFMTGSGVGEPLGVFNPLNNALVSQAARAGQTTKTIIWENLVDMYSRMLPSSLGSAVWVVSPDAFPELATMALSVGTGGSAVWLNNGVEGPPATILGRPVIISEKVNSLSSVTSTSGGDVNFVDFGQYLVGDRMAMSAMASTEYRFGNDVTAYRVIERVDGKPWMQSAITPKNSGPTLSPYVQLGGR